MSKSLPLIVGFGGYNAAGRSSNHMAYRRLVLESLSSGMRQKTLSSLASLMNLGQGWTEDEVLRGTLVRRIESSLFDAERVPGSRRVGLANGAQAGTSFLMQCKDLPKPLPESWVAEPLDEGGKQCSVTITGEYDVLLGATAIMPVQAAGQLPSGFRPADHYRSLHHPRGLQLAILGASDAVRSIGIEWKDIAQSVTPDQVGVYSSSVMSQLDKTGLGGMLQSRRVAERVTSKQLPLGLNSMPADFINAYVLGSLGSTAAVTGACATFLYNLRQGVEDIRSGRRKVAVVGSSEAPVIPEIIDGYAAMSALATDADLNRLDGTTTPDYRRASRPFGENCGFTLAESSQYVVLMADELAIELGANIYGAVPGVYVNADGYKKSISAPGAGNYITMGKAVGLARALLGDDVVRNKSFIQAHGSSTPQNRVTESKIFDQVARAFDIDRWPVSAVKAYVGHSLGPASGDQLAASLGVFEHGIVPGIKTIEGIAPDVLADRLEISSSDKEVGRANAEVAFLNSKGFGGNNATATVFSPGIAYRYLEKNIGKNRFAKYREKRERAQISAADYFSQADQGELNPIYEFGKHIIDESKIDMNADSIKLPGFDRPICLNNTEGYSGF